MLLGTLESGLMRTLVRRADTGAFPAVVAGVALAATTSMSVPFATLLVAAVLLAPRRWAVIALWSSLGAALGAAVLYLAFHHLGWARLFAAYPDVVRSSAWADATRWLTAYGIAALFVIAATPLPLTPALMFAAISRLPIAEVLLALWLGKLAKYLVYAWLASRFPEQAMQRGQRRIASLHAILAHAMSTGPAAPASEADRGDGPPPRKPR
jgi:membrane protein YqaA with SNARE-associated domain